MSLRSAAERFITRLCGPSIPAQPQKPTYYIEWVGLHLASLQAAHVRSGGKVEGYAVLHLVSRPVQSVKVAFWTQLMAQFEPDSKPFELLEKATPGDIPVLVIHDEWQVLNGYIRPPGFFVPVYNHTITNEAVDSLLRKHWGHVVARAEAGFRQHGRGSVVATVYVEAGDAIGVDLHFAPVGALGEGAGDEESFRQMMLTHDPKTEVVLLVVDALKHEEIFRQVRRKADGREVTRNEAP